VPFLISVLMILSVYIYNRYRGMEV